MRYNPSVCAMSRELMVMETGVHHPFDQRSLGNRQAHGRAETLGDDRYDVSFDAGTSTERRELIRGPDRRLERPGVSPDSSRRYRSFWSRCLLALPKARNQRRREAAGSMKRSRAPPCGGDGWLLRPFGSSSRQQATRRKQSRRAFALWSPLRRSTANPNGQAVDTLRSGGVQPEPLQSTQRQCDYGSSGPRACRNLL
jgi:hypothetical protein